jgi:hypothetical protein
MPMAALANVADILQPRTAGRVDLAPRAQSSGAPEPANTFTASAIAAETISRLTALGNGWNGRGTRGPGAAVLQDLARTGEALAKSWNRPTVLAVSATDDGLVIVTLRGLNDREVELSLGEQEGQVRCLRSDDAEQVLRTEQVGSLVDWLFSPVDA